MEDSGHLFLVELLQQIIGFEYISDLPIEAARGNPSVSDGVKKLRIEDYSLRDWNDALEYIVQKPAQDTAEAAYMLLISALADLQHK